MKQNNRVRDIVIPLLLFSLLIFTVLFDGEYTKIALSISVILNIIGSIIYRVDGENPPTLF